MLAEKLRAATAAGAADPSWDLANAVYQGSPINFFCCSTRNKPTGVFFKPDGLKMYVIGAIGDDVNEYDLSTAWDVSTASYLQNSALGYKNQAHVESSLNLMGYRCILLGLRAMMSMSTIYQLHGI
jgi:hypothetical protein